MPTFGRLIGAIMFGALAWYTTFAIVPLFPDDASLGWFQQVNTFFGLVAGWKVAGPRAGSGYNASLSYGLTTMFAMVFMALFTNSFFVMIDNSLRRLYDGPIEAVVDVFQLVIEHGQIMISVNVIGTLIIGGLISGVVTEFFGRRIG